MASWMAAATPWYTCFIVQIQSVRWTGVMSNGGPVLSNFSFIAHTTGANVKWMASMCADRECVNDICFTGGTERIHVTNTVKNHSMQNYVEASYTSEIHRKRITIHYVMCFNHDDHITPLSLLDTIQSSQCSSPRLLWLDRHRQCCTLSAAL